MTTLDMTIVNKRGEGDRLIVDITNLVIAGWAGRDKAAMEHHIAELEALGVGRPATTPTFYRVSANRLTQEATIQDSGPHGSGEVETLLIGMDGELYIGLGSDHTDRQAETTSVTLAKQMCDKPVASKVWPYEEVADHWDSLVLRSYATIDGERVLYQDGKISELLPPEELIRLYTGGGGQLEDDTAMFGGTVAAIGGIRPASRFEAELVDPVLGRTISFGYDVEVLPVLG